MSYSKRMSRRYYRYRRSPNTDPVKFLSLLFAVALFVTYYKMSGDQKLLTNTIVVSLAIVCVGLAIFLHFRRVALERKRLRALQLVDIAVMTGIEFEKYVAEILKDQGYNHVALTEYFDWGADLTAEKDGVRWGVQVKRYTSKVGAKAVQQVVAGLNKYNCQRAMVVTNSTYTRQARGLARSNNCVLIDRDILADWIVTFQEVGHNG